MTILVTGANGFIGTALCERLVRLGQPVRAINRTIQQRNYSGEVFTAGEINGQTDWRDSLQGVTQLIHLANRVHVMDKSTSDSLVDFRRINVEGSAALARQAASQGVKRFVFLSSVKVNGESTSMGEVFFADGIPAPGDPYALSKYEAEQELKIISDDTGMELVIIRPPLVYGRNVKGNLGLMLSWLASGIPLPLAGITENRRSFVALDNLVNLIEICLNHPAAANQTFLVSDGEDLSTASLLRRIGDIGGVQANLFYMPPVMLKVGAKIFNKLDLYQRLCFSLQVDIEKTRKLLDWTPVVSVNEGLRRIF